MSPYPAWLYKILDSFPSPLEERRTRYLTGSSFILAEAGRWLFGIPVVIAHGFTVIGLLCFLAWFVSGVLKARIEVQESAKRVLELFDRWYDEITLYHGHGVRWSEEVERNTEAARKNFREAVGDYTEALNRAHVGGWTLQGAREMARARQPLECGGWIDAGLRLDVKRHVLRYLL